MNEYEIIEILQTEIDNKRNTIKGMEEYQKGLEDNCAKFSRKIYALYKAGDAMAEVCKDEKLRLAWWDEKSRT